MFKSIECIRYNEDANSFTYNLVDSDFECEITVSCSSVRRLNAEEVTVLDTMTVIGAISEYKKRNCSHQDIVKNIFRCNLYFCNEYKYPFELLLSRQNKCIDFFYKDIDFSKLYYEELKTMWDKHKVFM